MIFIEFLQTYGALLGTISFALVLYQLQRKPSPSQMTVREMLRQKEEIEKLRIASRFRLEMFTDELMQGYISTMSTEFLNKLETAAFNELDKRGEIKWDAHQTNDI